MLKFSKNGVKKHSYFKIIKHKNNHLCHVQLNIFYPIQLLYSTAFLGALLCVS